MATTRKRNVEIEFIVDDKQATKSLRNIEGQVTKTGKGFASAAKIFGGLAIGSAVTQFVGDSIQAFSRLEQSVGGTEAVFGSARGSIDEFADGSAEAIGLAESEFRTATTSIGGQLKRMTGDVEYAAEQSIFLTTVAADLAATYGGTTAEAVTALGAAFRGEADPAERFNLNLKASVVNAKALELGLVDSNGKVTEMGKAQAIVALITEQSADAQGQFARESDTVAGSLQILNGRLEDLKARFGEEFAPAVSDAAKAGENLLDVFDEDVNLGWTQRLSAGLQTILGDSPEAVSAYIEQKDALNDVADAADAAAEGHTDFVPPLAEVTEQAEKEDDKLFALLETMDLLSAATGSAAEQQRDLTDAQKEAADPAFKLLKALDKYDEAQKDYTDAVGEFGRGSRKAQEEALDLAEAQADLNGAFADMSAEGGAQSIAALKDFLEQAGVLPESIQAIIDAIIDFNNTPVNRKSVFVPGVGTVTPNVGGTVGGGDNFLGFAEGGIVPGPKGAPVPALVHGGEAVFTPEQLQALGGAGGSGSSVTLYATSLSDRQFKELQEMSRRR